MKETLAGALLGLIVFLAFIGINVTPLILITLLLGGFYFFYLGQGTVKFDQVGADIKVGTGITFEHIGGQDSAIKELEEALEFIVKPDAIKKMGIRPLKGVLLVGPPGTGKTLMAKAAASYTGSAFIATSGSEFIEVYAGMGAKRVRQLFNDARKKASKQNSQSAIIFIDELEILGGKRGSHNSHMEYDQTLNQLLVEMDGISFRSEPRILIIGATNRADMLEEYRMEDAELALVLIGSTAGTAKAAVDRLREKGVKAGLVKIRVFRPFPGQELAKALAGTRAVAVMDKSEGFSANGGPLFSETCSALYDCKERPYLINIVYGLGGRDVTTGDIEKLFGRLANIAETGDIGSVYTHMGQRSREEIA
jgi:hypothetical protein